MASVPLGFGQITLTTTAALISSVGGGIPALANYVLATPEGAVRWRDDGAAPTATVGMPMLTSASLPYDGTLSALQFCSQSGSVVLNLAFYRQV